MSIASRNSSTGYTGTAKTLHWLIVALLIVQFIVAWIMPEIRRDTPVTTLISLHFTIGIVILGVAVIRLLFRLASGVPAPEAGMPAWQETAAQAVHWALYALLLIVPLLGWINADWRGMPVVMFGLELPHLIAARASGWQWTGDVHGVLANYAMLILVGLHVLAALYHHVVMRDGVLKRMMPGD
jgi:cytochrome b561